MRLRSALLAAAAGAVAFELTALDRDALTLARLAVCGAGVGVAVAIDLAERRIPNRVVLPAALACAALSIADPAALAAGLALVALLLAVSLARPAALGMGDVKLALLIAVGLDGSAPRALLAGLALAAAVGLLFVLRDHAGGWRRSLPLAPFLAAGALAALLL